jgi:HEAT repeat protein
MIQARGKTVHGAGLVVALLVLLSSSPAALARGEWYRELDLEQATGASDLILIVRVVEVSEAKTVSGGKAEYTIQQIKFAPVRTLKGVFTRDVLLLTTDDLGNFGEPVVLERGQLRLLLLGRSGRGYANANRQDTLDRAVPPLHDENDPLLASVKVLMAVTQQYDRGKKVDVLQEGLRQAKGPSAIPLLLALQRRALLAAQTAGAPAAVTRHLADPAPAVREAAVGTLRALLDADYLEQRDLRNRAAAALATLLEKPDVDLSMRVIALDALGAAGPATLANEAAAAQLKLDKPRDTFAERTAAVRAIGQLRMRNQTEAVTALLEGLPLDGPADLQAAAVTTLVHLDANQAANLITKRLKKKIALGLTVEAEIGQFAELPRIAATLALLDVFKMDLGPHEKIAFAHAAYRVADPRLVPALSGMLSPRQPQLRAVAIEALRKIDTLEAAQALQPHLKEEANLHYKLLIAEFLGRHGIRDGYPYAMEHLSEPGLVEQAVAALAAIRDLQTVPVLRGILKTSNDKNWNSVAIRALGAFGEKEFAPQFLDIVQDLKNPLAPAALIALGDLGEVKALPKVREGLASRNDHIVYASARAAGKLLAVPGVKADELRDQLAALLADADANQGLRQLALETLLTAKDPRLDKALLAVVHDAGLEGSALMVRTEMLLRERKVKV